MDYPIDDILTLFQQQHLLVVGDLMIDRYVLGTVGRISPEAPVIVFPQSHTHDRLGGAGNVTHCLVALGAQASFISVVGDDLEAAIAQDFLSQISVKNSYLIKDPSRPTSLKTRYISQNQQIMRVDREVTHPVSKDIEDVLFSKVKECLPYVKGVVLSDYAKGVLTPYVTRAIIDLCQHYTLPVFVDPKTKFFSKYRGASWIKPNRRELEEASHHPLHDHTEIHQACITLIQEHKLQGIIATRSEQGISLVSETESHHLPTQVVDVFDVSGAGDTVLGTFALAISAGLPPLVAADLSNHAAGVVVGKSGTATVSPEGLRAHKMATVSVNSKIFTPETVQHRLFDWRCHNLKIGFTNGCFDILHPGHISLIRQAKSRCDRLIIGLNSDASIKRLKGEERPVHDFYHRSHVLEALKYVDMIIGFEEDTPLNLILSLKPDILFKGKDYHIDQVVGAPEIISWGGTVELLDLVNGFSTTSTVNKLKRSA